MIADPEDLLMLLIAIAPVVALVLWLMHPQSKVRTRILLGTLLLFVVFLPITTLYLGVLFTSVSPELATSPVIGRAAPVVLVLATVLCVVLVIMKIVRKRKKDS